MATELGTEDGIKDSNGGGGGTGGGGGGVGIVGGGTAEPISGRVSPESRVFPLLNCHFGIHFIDFFPKEAKQFFPICP
jgi:hypothetical protein